MPVVSVQHLRGLASWLPPQAGMFMWMKLEGAVKDADDIIDALQDEKVAVVPGKSPMWLCILPLLCLLPATSWPSTVAKICLAPFAKGDNCYIPVTPKCTVYIPWVLSWTVHVCLDLLYPPR